MTTIAEYRRSRELFSNLTLRELRSKYKRSFLGWTWSMINPLANTLVYTLLFGVLLGAKVTVEGPSDLKVYALFLLAALLPWNFFQNSITSAVNSLTGGANLIKKTYFPRELLPGATVASALVSHLIEMGLLLTVLLCFGDYWSIFWLPVTLVLIVLTMMFGLGLGLMFSVLNVYFRDIEHFLNILFLLWLYAGPIVYPPYLLQDHHVPGTAKYRHVVVNGVAHSVYIKGSGINLLTLDKINPMTDMAILFRATMYYGHGPSMLELAYYAAWAIAALVVGLYVFNRFEGRLAEEL